MRERSVAQYHHSTPFCCDNCWCFFKVPPMIPGSQSEVSVIQGFQALLPCAAQGLPEPRVHWEKLGTAVPNLPGKFTVLRSGELIIERAEVSAQIANFSWTNVKIKILSGTELLVCFSLEMQVCSHVKPPMLQALLTIVSIWQSTWDRPSRSYQVT